MRIFIFLLIVFTSLSAQAVRSKSHVAAFKRSNPCPATGATSGPCKGYVVDHVKPLCAGGPDHPSNMQWQSVEEAKAKDREERRMCRK